MKVQKCDMQMQMQMVRLVTMVINYVCCWLLAA